MSFCLAISITTELEAFWVSADSKAFLKRDQSIKVEYDVKPIINHEKAVF
jgi:hypothetical protein